MTIIDWTTIGRRHAADHGVSPDIVEAMVLGDIERGDLIPDKLIAHSVELGDVLFIITPTTDGLLIDGARWVEGPELSEGPFAGKTFVYPQALSGGEE